MCELYAYCAAFKASAVAQMTSSLFRNVTQRKLVVTDVSRQNSGPHLQGSNSPERIRVWDRVWWRAVVSTVMNVVTSYSILRCETAITVVNSYYCKLNGRWSSA